MTGETKHLYQAKGRAISHQHQHRLRHFIEREADSLAATLRYYVMRAGLTSDQSAETAAAELLNEVVVEALQHAERLRPDAQPTAWLLGIAANLIKRKQVERAKRQRREPLIADLYPNAPQTMSEDELFDWLIALPDSADSEQELEANDELKLLFAALSEADQQVLRMALLHGFDGKALATALGIAPGAARVRLHRALNRLRASLTNASVQKEVGDE